MTHRESALMDYFYTIATDKKMKTLVERTIRHFSLENAQAVAVEFYKSIEVDLPKVLKMVLKNATIIGVENIVKPTAQKFVDDLISRGLGHVLHGVEDIFAGKKNK